MATIGTHLYTFLFGTCVGKDQFGNRYYRSRSIKTAGHIGRTGSERRWVVYAGVVEPSTIPPLWHTWIHHMTDALPSGKEKATEWQKPHLPSLTGTNLTYLPAGHEARGGKREKATGDYQAWKPKN